MYEPKALDFLTSNGKHILVYEYLDFPYTVKLANDIVIGITPESDEVVFMVPDENEVYTELTRILSQKPTARSGELFILLHNLWQQSKISGGKEIDREFFRKLDHNELKLNFYLKSNNT
jgi:hypothetical protein